MNLKLRNIIEQCKDLDGHELFRISCTINQLIKTQDKVNEIFSKCKIGLICSYFDSSQNVNIDCEIIELKKSKVTIKEIKSSKIWPMPYW
jgi:hypothetical protein